MKRTFRSFAKINLHLRVLGRRADGYHEIETVFQSVDLADLIDIDLHGATLELRVVEGRVPAGPANLAYQAAATFLERWTPGRPVSLSLRKRIPVGGGLGGGSSNAATVLLGLRELLGIPDRVEDLVAIARSLGADVPYFLVGGTALGTGRGDRIQPLADLSEREIWLVTPPVSISTATVFDDLDAGPVGKEMEAARGTERLAVGWDVAEWGRNDLEAVVFDRYGLVRDVYNVLVEAGATPVRLSGSGATVYAFFSESAEASGLQSKLPSGTRVVVTRTLTRPSLERQRVVQ